MTIHKNQYVPVLKWRMGEYQALTRLDDSKKDVIVPLIIVPPLEYDFEEEKMKRTELEHADTFVKRFPVKWKKRKAIIEVHDSLINYNIDIDTKFTSYIFKELTKNDCDIIPIIKISSTPDYIVDILSIVSNNKNGVAIRISLEEIMDPDVGNEISRIMGLLGVDNEKVDLIVDIGEPQYFEPYEDFSQTIVSGIKQIKDLAKFRSFVIIAMSLKLSQVTKATKTKPGCEIQRHEWHLYKKLTEHLSNLRVPTYGDYTIETPQFIQQDMRLMKPSAKVIYTSDDVWFVPKGTSFRDNPKQMAGHCQAVMNSGHYSYPKYSYGDFKIKECADNPEKTGNMTTWKQVGVNRHLVKVVDQLSNFHEL